MIDGEIRRRREKTFGFHDRGFPGRCSEGSDHPALPVGGESRHRSRRIGMR
jgi:hypothetical protein